MLLLSELLWCLTVLITLRAKAFPGLSEETISNGSYQRLSWRVLQKFLPPTYEDAVQGLPKLADLLGSLQQDGGLRPMDDIDMGVNVLFTPGGPCLLAWARRSSAYATLLHYRLLAPQPCMPALWIVHGHEGKSPNPLSDRFMMLLRKRSEWLQLHKVSRDAPTRPEDARAFMVDQTLACWMDEHGEEECGHSLLLKLIKSKELFSQAAAEALMIKLLGQTDQARLAETWLQLFPNELEVVKELTQSIQQAAAIPGLGRSPFLRNAFYQKMLMFSR